MIKRILILILVASTVSAALFANTSIHPQNRNAIASQYAGGNMPSKLSTQQQTTLNVN